MTDRGRLYFTSFDGVMHSSTSCLSLLSPSLKLSYLCTTNCLLFDDVSLKLRNLEGYLTLVSFTLTA